MVVGGRGEGEAGEGAVEGGRRGVDGVEEEVAAVAGGRGEGEAGGGEVAGPGVVGGREAVEVGRPSVHVSKSSKKSRQMIRPPHPGNACILGTFGHEIPP